MTSLSVTASTSSSLASVSAASRINIFLARLCFRGIYFPMMGKLAWLKVVAQNRQTIFKLVREGFFGRQSHPRNPDVQDSYEDMAARRMSAAK